MTLECIFISTSTIRILDYLPGTTFTVVVTSIKYHLHTCVAANLLKIPTNQILKLLFPSRSAHWSLEGVANLAASAAYFPLNLAICSSDRGAVLLTVNG